MFSVRFSEDQKEHCDRNLDISNRHSVILDTTIGGGGKTLFCLYFAFTKMIKKIIVLCPGLLHDAHWTKHKKKFNAPIINIITYDSLRGSRPNNNEGTKELLSHGLLNKLYGGKYEVSDLFKYYVEEGDFMIIVDESHSVKNESGKTEAVKTLTRYLTIRNMTSPLPKKRSYVYFCSMTPFDEPDHVINFASLTGCVRSETLYNNILDKPSGAYELYQYCRYFSQQESDIIWLAADVKSKNVEEITYKLMVNVFLKLISSFAKDCQKNFISKQSIYYAYFDFNKEDEKEGGMLMKKALDMIKAPSKNLINNMTVDNFVINTINKHNIIDCFENMSLQDSNPDNYDLENKFNEITGGTNPKLKDRAGVMHGMTTVQTIKTHYATINFIKKIFETVNNVKVVIFLSFKESLRMIMRSLAHLNPVSITGDYNCTEEVRNSIVAKFNEHNLDCRLLLIISQIGSDGIELDDSNGNFPRIGLAYPDFFNTRFSQCPARILRRFTMSNSLFFFIFMNHEKYPEESVLKSIKNKSKIMDETVRQNGITPPVYYEKISNPDKMDLNELLKNAGMKTFNTKIIGNVSENIIKINRSSLSKTF
jgi:hypothetical protein